MELSNMTPEVEETIGNCKLIQLAVYDWGIGCPLVEDNLCQGYVCSDTNDEPHDTCKACIAFFDREED